VRKCLSLIPIFFALPFLNGQPGVDVTFIANEGFLLNNGIYKILIDAIFSDGSGMFTTPHENILALERNAEEPFNAINFLLSTHFHTDHINPAYEVEHLVNDTGTVWIGPDQVYDLLAAQTSFDTIRDRLIPMLPDTDEKIDTLIHDYRFRIVRLVHYVNPENTIQNLGFIFTLGNINIFHPGDAFLNDTAEIASLDLAADSIGILFLSYRVLDNDFENLGRNIIRYLNPKAMILMHIPINQVEHYRKLVAGLQNLPPIYVMEEQMSKLTFIKNGESLIVENNLGLPDYRMASIIVFPNPARDKLIVCLPNPDQSVIIRLDLLDLFGNKVDIATISSGSKEASFNLTTLPKGLYILNITQGDRIYSRMIFHE
jgi:L-ascorbate metabolism protein UlaG (beta-lactamase superfamily)